MGCARSASVSSAWTASGASKLPMMKMPVASLIFMVCPLLSKWEAMHDQAIVKTTLCGSTHRATTGARLYRAPVLIMWIGLNPFLPVAYHKIFDSYPCILLNLALSMLAALQAPSS
ncbi:MAG TPA: DUF1003 domain-containing protein [Gallionella sp.]|nr:DUF1003 domain-containing protein [Gallionella sp.]